MSTSKSAESVPHSTPANQFPIVAIGASAGGLEAMIELLLNLPPDTGMAFIYVQHLSPDHKSMLTEILSKKTEMKVQEIDDMDKIKPNNVFVIPYNMGIEVVAGNIKLIPRSTGVSAISIDVLFSSLALAQKDRVIGIILSGSASDGTMGIKAIKHEGGLTFAQDDSAKFSSMPHSAIATGAVDYILSPKDIAHELERLSKHPFLKTTGGIKVGKEDLIDNKDTGLKAILDKLQAATGVDFGAYKINTIKRRIIRRMLLYRISTLQEYDKLLAQNKEEVDILYQDLLINVTSFFRETDTHKYLKMNLLPRLLKNKAAGETLRIWVPACATGEEAYSIAMMLIEIEGNKTNSTPVKIFATDLSEQSIAKARLGIYTRQELETVSPKRIQRFFVKADGNFRINKEIRNVCVFAPHNILKDPPFSRLDFISCCNLFIYLDTAAQKRALNTFHYALNKGGFLMLGKSENIGQSINLFTEFNKTYKIFSRKLNAGMQTLPALTPGHSSQAPAGTKVPVLIPAKSQKNIAVHNGGLDNAIDALLIAEFMPASVVINYEMEIVQFRGTTDLFLRHAKGKATFNILNMARPEFAFDLRNTILKVIKTRQRVRKTGVHIRINGVVRVISFEVAPLKITSDEPLLLVLFNEQEQSAGYPQSVKGVKAKENAKDLRIRALEEELAAAHADALATAQDQEAFNHELQSANEEVVSSNEELQTVNEELETSKEEIESANEELTASNQELQTRNDLLHESYQYADAIVSTMHEPMLVLDKGLRVKSANKAFYTKFNVTEEQTEGVLLYDLGNQQWNIPALRELLEDIIPKNAKFYNYEVKHTFLNLGEKIMSLNASRIIQNTHREQLILLIISDITEVRQLIVEKELMEKELLNKEIKDRNEEKIKLEKAVANRTKELKKANESLGEKNIALENMNKELEAFTYVSSHDLQEPVRKIQAIASRILEKENANLTDSGKNYFRLMQKAANRMQHLIQDLLAFSLIKAADRVFEKINLKVIIDDVKLELKDVIAESKAVIASSKTCEVEIIPFQFRQLMYNLISNSLKFSRQGVAPMITITAKNEKYSKAKNPNLPIYSDYCHIIVTDNGIGFDEAFSDKIFEVFQKLHGKDEFDGTGIGLAIVKKIVENHHGIITAHAKLNKGATFNIYIPATQKR